MAEKKLAETWPEQIQEARYVKAGTIQFGVIIQLCHLWRFVLHRAYLNIYRSAVTGLKVAYATWQELGHNIMC